MIILTLKTDQPTAEIALFDDGLPLASLQWEAHKKLAETIHLKIQELIQAQHCSLEQIEGVVFYKGPGSFTGLRIGASVANGFASALDIPIVGTTGQGWRENGIRRINDGNNDKVVVPEYGAPVHITTPKK